MRRIAAWAWWLPACCALTLPACAPSSSVPPASVAFDTATVWIRQGPDSASVVVEVASSRRQHEVGLTGRTALDPESGMLFLFDPPRSADEGFWMWQTRVPLDIAFISDGVVRTVLGMEPCAATNQDDCPGYFAEANYDTALEMSRGWFGRHRIGVGARVRIVR